MYRLINAIGFQTAWWACVAGVGHGLEVSALAYCSALAAAHLVYVDKRWQELQLAAVALAIGVGVDTALQYFSVIHFYGWSLRGLSPFWLWALWVLFAMTLNWSLAFLKAHPLWLSAAAGLLFGPLTYFAGAELGAASFEGSVMQVSALALAWMLALPAMVVVATRISANVAILDGSL
jgi:hypothetical protein